jgi:hypothetical protein
MSSVRKNGRWPRHLEAAANMDTAFSERQVSRVLSGLVVVRLSTNHSSDGDAIVALLKRYRRPFVVVPVSGIWNSEAIFKSKRLSDIEAVKEELESCS